MVKFYALTGLSNDQDSYTMTVAAFAACLRVALSYPKVCLSVLSDRILPEITKTRTTLVA
jgi:hypothetical protein